MAGNITPSYYHLEVLFTMFIIGLGLLLLAVLIGNMTGILQGLGQRRLESVLRRRDIDQWMRKRRLPKDIQKKVRVSERCHWDATEGIDEETLIEHLPEDLQTEIRLILFAFVTKLKIFSKLGGQPILDEIFKRLRQKIYVKEGTVLKQGEFVTKIIFITRGEMESTDKDKVKVSLLEGDVCGEELLEWCLEDTRNNTKKENKLISNRTVKCVDDVEAFVLRVEDLKEVISLYFGPHVPLPISSESLGPGGNHNSGSMEIKEETV